MIFVIQNVELGWDNVTDVVEADNKDQVYEYLANQNVGDTVENWKKDKNIRIHEYTIIKLIS